MRITPVQRLFFRKDSFQGWRAALQCAACVATISSSFILPADASVWSNGSANWNSNADPGWNGTGVPNAIGAVAEFPTISAATTATLTATATTGSILYDTTGNFGLTVTPTSALTLNQDSGGAGSAVITNSNSDPGLLNSLLINTGTITLADNLTITNSGGSTNPTGAIQIAGIMGGSGNVTLRNESTSTTGGFIRLTGANNFAGTVLVQKGITTIATSATALGAAANVVTIGDASGGGQGSAALISTSAIAVANPITIASGSGGTLTLGSTSTSTPSYTNTITLNDNLTIISASTNANGMLLSGKITGGFALALPTTNGNVRLNNLNSDFSGGLTLTGGTLNLFSSTDTTDSATYTKGPLGHGTLTLSGGKIDSNGGTGGTTSTLANPIFVTSSTSTTITAVGTSSGTNVNLTFSGPITGSGTIRVDAGSPAATGHAANITLSGSLAGFTGTIEHVAYDTVAPNGSPQANTLVLGGNSTGATNGSTVKFVTHGVQNRTSNGRGLRVDGGTAGVFQMGELSSTVGDGGLILAATNNTSLEIGALNTNTTYAGGFADVSVLSLVKVGTGTLTLANVQSMYSGTSTVRAGTLAFTQDVATVSVTGLIATTGWTNATDIITAGVPHGLAVGDTVQLSAAAAGMPVGTLQSTLYYVASAPSTTTFTISATPGGLPVDLTGTSAAGGFYHVGTLGSANSTVQLGDAGSTTSTPITLRMDAAKTFSRPISVNATADASVTTIGGGTDANSTFAGAISLAKDVSLTSAALGANAVNVSGVISSIGTFGLTKIGTGNATLSVANTYSGNTTVSNGVLNVTGSIANNNFDKVFIAAPDNTLAGNAILNRSIAASTSYADFGSTEVGGLGSTVELLAGTSTAATTLGMQWRLRLDTEKTVAEGGTPSSPPLSTENLNGLVSDVVDLNGLGTDLYVLQMSYDETKLVNPESTLALTQALYLGSFNTGTGLWENAVIANTGNNAIVDQHGFAGSFANFQTTYGSTLANYVGAWGVDTTNNVAWAVVNHNSEFAVVPEPSAMMLMFVGSATMWLLRKERKM